MAYYCLHKLHWPPSRYLELSREEKAFVIAAVEMKLESDRKRAKEMERKAKKKVGK